MDAPKFEFFVSYWLDNEKLLDREFELQARPGPSDDEAYPASVRMKLTGRDLKAMVQKGPPPEDHVSPLANGVCIGDVAYDCPRDEDASGFALLASFLGGLRTPDEDLRSLCAGALTGGVEFYLLGTDERLVDAYDCHRLWMFSPIRDESGVVTGTKVFKFWYAALTADPFVSFFRTDANDDDYRPRGEDVALARARVARDFQRFFRHDPHGPFWATMFAQRARNDAELSRTLVLCLPELPGLAADHLAHTLRIEQSEIQSAMANRVADQMRQSMGWVVIRLEVLILVVVIWFAILVLRHW